MMAPMQASSTHGGTWTGVGKGNGAPSPKELNSSVNQGFSQRTSLRVLNLEENSAGVGVSGISDKPGIAHEGVANSLRHVVANFKASNLGPCIPGNQ